MKHPKIIRHILSARKEGNSLYVLIPFIINQFWGIDPEMQIIMEFNTTTNKLSMRKEGVK